VPDRGEVDNKEDAGSFKVEFDDRDDDVLIPW